MEKIVRKQGNSYLIRLDAEDVKIYNLKEGDVLDIEICKKEVKENDDDN